jgi:hypothetical protein
MYSNIHSPISLQEDNCNDSKVPIERITTLEWQQGGQSMKVQRLGLIVLAFFVLLTFAPVFAQNEELQLTLPEIGTFHVSDLASLALLLDDVNSNKASHERLDAAYGDVFALAQAWWNPIVIDELAKNGIFQDCAPYKKLPLFSQQEELEREFLRFITLCPCRPLRVEALRQFVLEKDFQKTEHLSTWRQEAIKELVKSIGDPYPPEETMLGYNQLLIIFWLARENPLHHKETIEGRLTAIDKEMAKTRAQRDKALYQAIVAYNRMVSNDLIRKQPDFKLSKESQLNLLAGIEDALVAKDLRTYEELIFYFLQNTVGGSVSYTLAHFPFSKRREIEKIQTARQCVDFLASLKEPTEGDWLNFAASDLLMAVRANILLPTPADSIVVQGEGLEFFGGLLFPIDEKSRSFFKLPSDLAGYFIDGINEGSLCHQWGLYDGDILLEVNGAPIVNMEKSALELERKLNSGAKQIDFKIFRNNEDIVITAKLEKEPLANKDKITNTTHWPSVLVAIFIGGALTFFVRKSGKKAVEVTANDNASDTQARMTVLTSLAALEDFFAPRYKNFRMLGKGGMGLVYRVSDKQLQREVALKVISPLLVEDKEIKRRFLREVRALAALEHNGIVSVFDFGQAQIPFYTMELVEGVSMRTLIEQDELTGKFEEIIKIAQELSEIISYAHEQGVIHRDIKPANIIMRKEGGIKLIDFGVAAIEGSTTITHSQAVIGTPAFFAPEVVAGSSTSALSDQYSFGKVLYLLVGGSTAAEAVGTAFLGPPKPLAEVSPNCPKELITVIERCMASKADERFPSMSHVRSHL